MLFFVFGLPGGFTEWCGAATLALLQKAGRPAAAIKANTLDELTIAIMQAGSSHAVIESSYPGGQLRTALTERRKNFLVVLDDPRSALIDLTIGRGVALAEAIRVLASSCAVLGAC